MANYYYGLNRGQEEFDVTAGTATAGTDIEFFVNGTTAGIGRQQAVQALGLLKDYLLQNNWPLAAAGDYFIGLNAGQGLKEIVGAAATNSTDFELRINATTVTVRNAVVHRIRPLQNAVLRLNFPPA